MEEYKAHKFSLELPVFALLNTKNMTSKELSIDIGVDHLKILKAMLYYLKLRYVTAKIDYSTKYNPNRYNLTKKGRTKLKKMLQLKRDYPEQWGKPKSDQISVF